MKNFVDVEAIRREERQKVFQELNTIGSHYETHKRKEATEAAKVYFSGLTPKIGKVKKSAAGVSVKRISRLESKYRKMFGV